MADLVLRLFGPPRLSCDGTRVHVGRRKALAMLIYLAVTRQPHSRDLLAALLWPESSQSEARSMVRSALRTLTRTIGSDWLGLFEDQISLVEQPGLWVDVLEFRSRIAAAFTHPHAPDHLCQDCIENLTQAIQLAHSAFLEGYSLAGASEYELWQSSESAVLQSELSDALKRLVLIYANNGRMFLPLAVQYAQQWVRLDPLHEPPHRALMRLYAWQGDNAAVLYQYEDCRRRLAAELDIAPSSETELLLCEIRSGHMPAPVLSVD